MEWSGSQVKPQSVSPAKAQGRWKAGEKAQQTIQSGACLRQRHLATCQRKQGRQAANDNHVSVLYFDENMVPGAGSDVVSACDEPRGRGQKKGACVVPLTQDPNSRERFKEDCLHLRYVVSVSRRVIQVIPLIEENVVFYRVGLGAALQHKSFQNEIGSVGSSTKYSAEWKWTRRAARREANVNLVNPVPVVVRPLMRRLRSAKPADTETKSGKGQVRC